MKTTRLLLLICLAALGFRLLLGLLFVRYPGIADPNHYYNMGVRLSEGDGFTIDYIWQYNDTYPAVTHPDDYWMPLTSLLVAAPLTLFGAGTAQGLAPFILLGALIPLIAFWAARQLRLSDEAALFAAAAAAFLPELVLNSLRTDTTVPNTLLVGASLLCLTAALRSGRWRWWLGAGVAAGLAYLTRSENILLLPVALVALILYAIWGERRAGAGRLLLGFALMAGLAVLIALPWSLRTLGINGTLSTPTTSNMFFLTTYDDHYLFDTKLTLQTYLASQSVGQIIGKRLFEMAASVKIILVTLDGLLLVPALGGLLLIIGRRERERLLALAPVLLMLAALFAFYTLAAPFKSQGGSFKKAFISLIPLLLPLAAYGLTVAIANTRYRRVGMGLILGVLAFNATDLVRLDAQTTTPYFTSILRMRDAAVQLPDRTGDGTLTFMTQDPFALGYAGLSAVMFPQGDRDVAARVAERYGVDYLLMPAGRAALDALQDGETDPRFTPDDHATSTDYSFYAVNTPQATP